MKFNDSFWLFFVLFLDVFVSFARSEAFSSTANLVSLVEAERDLIPTLENYIRSEEQKLASIKR